MSDTESAPPTDRDADIDELFDALSHARRRSVLSYLHEADDDVAALSDLVDWVTTQEADGEADRRETVVVTLHHNHLPKLAACGLIEYDSESETVRYHGQSTPEREQSLVGEILSNLT